MDIMQLIINRIVLKNYNSIISSLDVFHWMDLCIMLINSEATFKICLTFKNGALGVLNY